MAPDGADEGDDADVRLAPSPPAAGPVHFFIGEATANRLRARSSPTAPRPGPCGGTGSCADAPAGADAPEQLQLLSALWESQQAILQEEEVIQRAAAAQADLCMRNEIKRQELRELEAELLQDGELCYHAASSASSVSPLSGRCWGEGGMTPRRADEEEDPAVAEEGDALRAANAELLRELRDVEARLRDLSAPSGRRLAPERRAAAPEIEALETELAQLRRQEVRREGEHRRCIEELRARLREAEDAGGRERRALREALVEVCADREFLESELEGCARARDAALQRLRREERWLGAELQEVSRAPEARSRSGSVTTLGSAQSGGLGGSLLFELGPGASALADEDAPIVPGTAVAMSVAKRCRKRSTLASAVSYRSPGLLRAQRRRDGDSDGGRHAEIDADDQHVARSPAARSPRIVRIVEQMRGPPDELTALRRRAVEAGLLFGDARRLGAEGLRAWLRQQLEDASSPRRVAVPDARAIVGGSLPEAHPAPD